jgi:hypothetical protein
MVAQVAADEPDTEPKMPQPRMVVCIRRPGTRFSQGARPSNICSDNLVRKRISPIQMNSGRAASSHEALDSHMAENRFLPQVAAGSVVNSTMPTQPTRARVIAIQTPPVSSISITMSRNPPTSTTFIRPR